jgi:flagellar hook-basal body complex protein FliE
VSVGPIEGVPLLRPHEAAHFPTPEIGQGKPPEGVAPFADVLENMVAGANSSANVASETAEAFAAGRRDDIHGTMLALSQADIELRYVGNVRNKIIDAFYELWRMQI